MKEFFKILANMEITSFILVIIPVPFCQAHYISLIIWYLVKL